MVYTKAQIFKRKHCEEPIAVPSGKPSQSHLPAFARNIIVTYRIKRSRIRYVTKCLSLGLNAYSNETKVESMGKRANPRDHNLNPITSLRPNPPPSS